MQESWHGVLDPDGTPSRELAAAIADQHDDEDHEPGRGDQREPILLSDEERIQFLPCGC